ncbi:hypothetical protein FWK35_00015976, partial [Aphis craccivora]
LYFIVQYTYKLIYTGPYLRLGP